MNTGHPTARNPFEVFMLIGLVAVGLPYVFGLEVSTAMEEVLAGAGPVWGLVLALGAGTALYGMAKRDPSSSIIVEQIGLVVVGLATLFYVAVMIIANREDPAGVLVSLALATSYGASCLWRWRQLQQQINRAAAVEASHALR